MMISYTPMSLILVAAIAISVALAIPPIFNGVTVIDAGKHRIWFSRKGWVYNHDRQGAGTYSAETVDGVIIAKTTYWSKAGNWPW